MSIANKSYPLSPPFYPGSITHPPVRHDVALLLIRDLNARRGATVCRCGALPRTCWPPPTPVKLRWLTMAKERRTITQPAEPPQGLPQEEPVVLMSENLDMVRDALQTMTRVCQKGWAVA